MGSSPVALLARHFVAEEVLGHGEDTLVRLEVVCGDVDLHLLRVEAWHRDRALGLGYLGVGENVLAVDALVRLGDREGPALEVEAAWVQREEFPLPHDVPVERLEGVEGGRLVHDGVGEAEVLALGPEPHLAGGLGAHGFGPAARVRREPVEAHGVVEERAELVVDGLEVLLFLVPWNRDENHL